MTCKKSIDKKYKDRPSPPYPANDCKKQILEGNDGDEYISLPDKNGIYKWKKIMFKNSAEEYYCQFPENKPAKYDEKQVLKKLDLIKQKLLQDNIYLYDIGWKDIGNFIDNAWNDVVKLIEKQKYVQNLRKIKENKNKYIGYLTSFVFYTDHQLYWAKRNGELFFQHNILTKDKQKVIKIFKEQFGKNFKWDGSRTKSMMIKLPKK